MKEVTSSSLLHVFRIPAPRSIGSTRLMVYTDPPDVSDPKVVNLFCVLRSLTVFNFVQNMWNWMSQYPDRDDYTKMLHY